MAPLQHTLLTTSTVTIFILWQTVNIDQYCREYDIDRYHYQFYIGTKIMHMWVNDKMSQNAVEGTTGNGHVELERLHNPGGQSVQYVVCRPRKVREGK